MQLPGKFEHSITVILIPGILSILPIAIFLFCILTLYIETASVLIFFWLSTFYFGAAVGFLLEAKSWVLENKMDSEFNKLINDGASYEEAPILLHNKLFLEDTFLLSWKSRLLKNHEIYIALAVSLMILTMLYVHVNLYKNEDTSCLYTYLELLLIFSIFSMFCIQSEINKSKCRLKIINYEDKHSDSCYKIKEFDICNEWFKYLSWATNFNIIGFKYITRLMERMFFTLGFGNAILSACAQLHIFVIITICTFYEDFTFIGSAITYTFNLILTMLLYSVYCKLMFVSCEYHRSLNYTRYKVNLAYSGEEEKKKSVIV